MDNVRSMGKERNTCKFLCLKPEEESHLGRSKPRWQGYIEKAGRVWTEFIWLVIGHRDLPFKFRDITSMSQ